MFSSNLNGGVNEMILLLARKLPQYFKDKDFAYFYAHNKNATIQGILRTKGEIPKAISIALPSPENVYRANNPFGD